MKKIICLTIILLTVISSVTFAQAEINGELDQSLGIPVLKVWGTPYEMGYAHGALLGGSIKDEFESYIMPLTLHTAIIYESVLEIFKALYFVPEKYEQEAKGLIDGALDAGYDLFIPTLGRELTAIDIAATGAMPDIIGLVSCSSLIAWGDATIDSPSLYGALALVRNMDWMAVPSSPTYLAQKTIILARTPAEGRQTISIYFPGLIGCLSCMNDAGVSALQHQVHIGVLFFNRDYSEKFVPINLSMREGLELIDPDGDGISTTKDVAFVVEKLPKSSQYNIVLADSTPKINPPFCLETSNAGSIRRYDFDDAEFPSSTIGITNHFRLIKSPNWCRRYNTIRENANKWYGEISLERMWENNRQVAMTSPIGSITAQTMIFIPSERTFALAYSDDKQFAPEKIPVWFAWEDIFETQSSEFIPTPQDIFDDDSSDDDSDDNLEYRNKDIGGCGC